MNATFRSLDDAKAKQALLSQYIAECERIDELKALLPLCDASNTVPGQFDITNEETLEVFERRRDRLHDELVNCGIRLHAETSGLKSLAGVIEQNHANKD